jgi:TrbL/VirB6 plasmid conjugal transfer protein
MNRRTALWSVVIAVAFALTSTGSAYAKYRGTDMWGNLMPGTGDGGLIGRYPLSSYMLDYHVDAGVTHPDGIPSMITQWLASWIFFAATLFMRMVIAIFQWAYSVDLVTGSGGLLAQAAPISQGYYDDYVRPFMATAAIMFGCWLLYKASKREHSDTGGAIIRVLVMTVISIAIVYHPQETIGRAYSMVDGLSTSIVARGGSTGDAADTLFETFVYRPWTVIEFGGLQTCTSRTETDDDGFPKPVKATSKTPKICHGALAEGADGHGDYAHRFLRYAPGSAERKAEYDALREGQVPDTPQFADIKIDKTDAPAVDMMQAQGSLQRIAFVLLMVGCMVFGALLIALVSIAALFAQIAIALLFILAPFLILVALYPPAHGLYMRWASLLGKALIGKLVYSLVLAIPLSTSAALLTIGGTAGYFIAFALQALLFGGVFIKRRVIVEKLTSSKTAERYSGSENAAVAGTAVAAAASFESVSGGAKTFASTMREGWAGGHPGKQGDEEHAPDSSSPPASAGREYSPPGPPVAQPAPASSPGAHQNSFQDDLESERGRRATSTGDATMIAASKVDNHEPEEEGMPTTSFADDLERERSRRNGVPRADHAREDLDEDPQREPARLVALSSFADDLEQAQLARERPLPPEDLERARRR